MYKVLILIFISFSFSSCNSAMVAGFADGMNRGLSSPSQRSSYEMRKLKREMQEQKDELEKMKRDAKWECIRKGGSPIGGQCY